MKKIISTGISMMIFFTSCDPLKPRYKECEVDGHTNYQFNLPFYYTPNTDTILLGDTLWIESTFSSQLLNENNGKTYTLNDFKFGLVGGGVDLSTNPVIGYAGFILIDTLGQIDSANKNGPYIYVKYTNERERYYWKRGIVLNKPGAFYVSFFSDLNSGNLFKSGQSITKCPNEYVNIQCKPMNVSNNYYLVETSPDPYIKQGEYAFRNTFIFYVKE